MIVEFIIGCATFAGTVLGSVALLANSKKRDPDPVAELRFATGEKTMNDLKDRIDGLEHKIDEMPAKVARLVKALG